MAHLAAIFAMIRSGQIDERSCNPELKLFQQSGKTSAVSLNRGWELRSLVANFLSDEQCRDRLFRSKAAFRRRILRELESYDTYRT